MRSPSHGVASMRPIARSPHFRGHSRLHNERDFREQIHFGRELPTATDRAEAFWRLQGPNLWPDDPAWRLRMLEYMHQVEHVGRRLLRKVAQALGLEARRWLGSDPYLLAKCIGSPNSVNVVRATIKGLQDMTNPEEVARKRGKKVEEIT